MRTRNEIINTSTNKRYWTDQDVSRKAHQTDILIEVLIDIRDILEMRLREINSDIYKIAQKD